MVNKYEVLELIESRTKEGKSASCRTLAAESGLSLEASCSHLKRLWRERLIRTDDVPARRRPSLGPGESIRDLGFKLAARGRQWLRWDRGRIADDEWRW